MTEKHISILLKFFQYFYLFSAILMLVMFITAALQGSVRIDILIPVIVSSIIAFGIFNKRTWVFIPVTMLAAWGIATNIFAPVNVSASIFSIIFLSLEIYFFNSKEAKAYLNAKNTTS